MKIELIQPNDAVAVGVSEWIEKEVVS